MGQDCAAKRAITTGLMEMGLGGEAGKKEEVEVVVFRRGWDCGSVLYDSCELASVYRVLDSHLIALPVPYHARGLAAQGTTERPTARRTAAMVPSKAKGWRRRKTAAAAAAAGRKGKAVLHSIIRSVTCSRRL